MPDPDLPPVVLTDADMVRIRAALTETPAERVERYCALFGLGLFDAEAMALAPANR
jgi:aspartyl-tRNA(Asn)/glutamyl-tRNA(Gln) amidotransferase subunit B